MKTHEYVAPAHWAVYFFNDDPSGMEDDDIAAADAFIERVGLGAPVECEDAGFVHWHDARQECPFAAGCQTYTFLED